MCNDVWDEMGQIAGMIWNIPNDIIGIGIGILDGIATFAMTGQLPSISFGNNALQITGLAVGNGALTLGNVQLYANATPGETITSPYTGQQMVLGDHEEAHTYQSELLGPFFLPVYLLSGGISGSNPYEVQADMYATGQGGPIP